MLNKRSFVSGLTKGEILRILRECWSIINEEFLKIIIKTLTVHFNCLLRIHRNQYSSTFTLGLIQQNWRDEKWKIFYYNTSCCFLSPTFFSATHDNVANRLVFSLLASILMVLGWRKFKEKYLSRKIFLEVFRQSLSTDRGQFPPLDRKKRKRWKWLSRFLLR